MRASRMGTEILREGGECRYPKRGSIMRASRMGINERSEIQSETSQFSARAENGDTLSEGASRDYRDRVEGLTDMKY